MCVSGCQQAPCRLRNTKGISSVANICRKYWLARIPLWYPTILTEGFLCTQYCWAHLCIRRHCFSYSFSFQFEFKGTQKKRIVLGRVPPASSRPLRSCLFIRWTCLVFPDWQNNRNPRQCVSQQSQAWRWFAFYSPDSVKNCKGGRKFPNVINGPKNNNKRWLFTAIRKQTEAKMRVRAKIYWPPLKTKKWNWNGSPNREFRYADI